MKQLLIATDLDGTAVNDAGEVSQNNLEAIRWAHARGVPVVPATGRTYYELPPELLAEDAVEYVVYSNGAGVVNRKTGAVRHEFIPYGTAKIIFDRLLSWETMVEIYIGGEPVTDTCKRNRACYERYRIDPGYFDVLDATRRGVEDFSAFFDTPKEPEMIHVFFRNQAERSACMEWLSHVEGVEVTTSMENNLEILKKGVNKGAALLWLCGELGIGREHIVAMGDSSNDLSLLSAAGIPLAVSNACPALKAIAQQVICSNNDDAVAYAVKRYAGEA